jgi:Fic family protein
LLALHRGFHSRLEAGSVRLSKQVDRLFFSPLITVNQYKSAFGVTYPTARSDLKKLEGKGIVQFLTPDPEITYFSPEIFRVTFEEIEP